MACFLAGCQWIISVCMSVRLYVCMYVMYVM